jgi:hypothetical protein
LLSAARPKPVESLLLFYFNNLAKSRNYHGFQRCNTVKTADTGKSNQNDRKKDVDKVKNTFFTPGKILSRWGILHFKLSTLN